MSVNAGDLIAGLARLGPASRDAFLDAAIDWADEVLNEAVPLTPIEEGPLSASGTTDVDSSGSGVEAAVGFGKGASRKYAVKQHEDLTLRHDNGRQGHYLSEPVQRRGARILEDALRRHLGRVFR